MSRLFLTFAFLLVIQTIYCQTDSLGGWLANLSVGIEAHDKRLFDYSEKESLLAMQPEFWGTFHLGVNIKRKFLHKKRVTSFIGLGINYENATFLRPFDHIRFERDYDEILRNLNKYEKGQLPLICSTFYEFGNHFFLSGQLVSNILLYRSIDHTENNSDVFPYSENTLELNDINFRLGINYKINKWLIGFNSRMINFQKIDKIIFNDIIKDPRGDQSWEWNNPLQFDFTIGYMW